MTTVGQRIRTLRRHRKLTLAQVGKRAGISVPYLSDVERGRMNSSLKTLNKIAAALETTTAELLDENAAWSERVRALERVANAAVRHQRRYLLTSPEANDLARALLELVETGWEPEEE